MREPELDKEKTMINAQQIQHENENKPQRTVFGGLKQHVNDSPLLAIGAAAGVGALAYVLLMPRPKTHRGITGAVASAFGGRSSAAKTVKAAIGSLAISYLTRKLRSRIRW